MTLAWLHWTVPISSGSGKGFPPDTTPDSIAFVIRAAHMRRPGPSRGFVGASLLAALLFWGWGAFNPVRAQTRDGDDACGGPRIEEIQVHTLPIFETSADDSGIGGWLLRTANALHVRTRPSFVRGELLFSEGDCLDPFLLQESQRLLLDFPFLGQARVYSQPLDDGNVRVVVETRDEWSTQVDVGISYDEGLNLEKLEITEENFLGNGVFASLTHRQRREAEDLIMRLATQRFFGRADANLQVGQTRPGTVVSQWLTYPFVAETGRISLREFFLRRTRFFPYSTGVEGENVSNYIIPVLDERAELSAARRFGKPGHLYMLGLSLTRDLARFPGTPEVAWNHDFGAAQPLEGSLPQPILRQLQPQGATRVALHAGLRRVHHRIYSGLDAISGQQNVELGTDLGLTLGWSVPFLTPKSTPRARDLFARARLGAGRSLGSSVIVGQIRGEGRREDGFWQDVLAEGDIFAYLRSEHLPNQTFFTRVSATGGWRTYLPYQLTLGGRDGVRAFREDDFPTGRRVLLTVENRIRFPWPQTRALELGATLFADAGRGWKGDVPFGTDQGWVGTVGFGLRIGLPAGGRNVTRLDLAFPVGAPGRGPVFRMTVFERHGLRLGFSEEQIRRSRRFEVGPEIF